MNTVKEITVEEFNKHFNRLPVNYKSKTGKEYVTFVTTLSIFKQVVSAEDNKNLPLGQILVCIDKAGNKCKLVVGNNNGSDEEFKMIAAISNTITGEKIALLAVD